MKYFIFLLFTLNGVFSFGQEAKITMDPTSMEMVDSLNMSSKKCNLYSFGGRYYFNTLENTRTTLAENGFVLDQEAVEFQLRLFELPKIFYFHQFGTLANRNYVSVTGFGLKEDFRFPIFKRSKFFVTPYVELGAGYYRMSIAKNIQDNSFVTVLNADNESLHFDNFVLSGDVGIDIGYTFLVNKHQFSIAANGGFIANLPSEWRIAGSLAFKEKIQLASPYAGVTLRLDMTCDDNCCK